jgi:hypothetical protein
MRVRIALLLCHLMVWYQVKTHGVVSRDTRTRLADKVDWRNQVHHGEVLLRTHKEESGKSVRRGIGNIQLVEALRAL